MNSPISKNAAIDRYVARCASLPEDEDIPDDDPVIADTEAEVARINHILASLQTVLMERVGRHYPAFVEWVDRCLALIPISAVRFEPVHSIDFCITGFDLLKDFEWNDSLFIDADEGAPPIFDSSVQALAKETFRSKLIDRKCWLEYNVWDVFEDFEKLLPPSPDVENFHVVFSWYEEFGDLSLFDLDLNGPYTYLHSVWSEVVDYLPPDIACLLEPETED